jgi:hypothetical protein
VVSAADTEVETAAMEIGFAPENNHTFLGGFIKLRHTTNTNGTEVEVARKRERFPTKKTLNVTLAVIAAMIHYWNSSTEYWLPSFRWLSSDLNDCCITRVTTHPFNLLQYFGLYIYVMLYEARDTAKKYHLSWHLNTRRMNSRHSL